MRITLHDYRTDPALPQKDGVNLAHENIAAVLRGSHHERLAVSFHDLNRLLCDEDHAREVLGSTDCVVSNVGPHAHYYFHLRDKLGLDFSIFRDVRTAIWSSYLLQEHLCRPFLRPRDVLMVASHYTHGLYERIFPHLRDASTLRCYPLTVSFPAELPPRAAPGGSPATRTLGYVGRLSEDKNFPDLLELLVALNQRSPGSWRLLACGDVHSPSCEPGRVREQLRHRLGEGDFFEYLPARPHGEVWPLYRRFDAMVFPSTSNLETLGRVLIEASYAGVPVVCGEHAAAPELMPAAALCPVSYETGRSFSTHFDHRLGRVNVDAMAAALGHPALAPSRCHLDYQQHPAKLVRALARAAAGLGQEPEPLVLAPTQQAFIGALQLDMPAPLEHAEAAQMVDHLMAWFIDLQRKGGSERERRLAQLMLLSRHPERTQRFIRKSQGTRCDFTDVGGIDIELCHVAGFYPAFSLRHPATRAARQGVSSTTS